MDGITTRQRQWLDHRNEIISQRIRVGMARQGIRSVPALSKKTNIPSRTLYHVLEAPLQYSFDRLYLISLAIKTDLGDLIGGVKE
jgi:predicted transcriptional regulator